MYEQTRLLTNEMISNISIRWHICCFQKTVLFKVIIRGEYWSEKKNIIHTIFTNTPKDKFSNLDTFEHCLTAILRRKSVD